MQNKKFDAKRSQNTKFGCETKLLENDAEQKRMRNKIFDMKHQAKGKMYNAKRCETKFLLRNLKRNMRNF